MKKWLLVFVLLIAAVVAYVAAGPYLAINGIREALATQDVAALERHVDFPTLRLNMKAHVEDYIARKGGGMAESGGLLSAIGMRIAGGLGNTAVDTMVTPLGIGACCKVIARGCVQADRPSMAIPMATRARRTR